MRVMKVTCKMPSAVIVCRN